MTRLPDPRDQPVMTVVEVGRVLGLSKSSAYEGVRCGEIPSIKVGRRILVPTAALWKMLHQPIDRPDGSIGSV